MTYAEARSAPPRVSRLALLQWVNLLGAPLLMVGFVLVEGYTGSGDGSPVVLALVALLGSIVVGVFFYLTRAFARRSPWGESWRFIVAVLVVAGILRALTLEACLAFFGITDEVAFLTRLANSLVLIPVTFGLALRGLEFIVFYRQRRSQLIRLLLESDQQLRRQVLPSSGVEKSLIDTVERDLSAVNEELARALLEAKRVLTEESAHLESLGRVREHADTQWRTISHRLWERSAEKFPRMSAREFVNTVALLRPLSLAYLALGAFFLFALAIIRLFPLGEALLWTLGWYAAMAVASLYLNELPQRASRPGLVFSLLFIPYTLGGVFFLVAPDVPEGQGFGAAGIHLTIAVSMILIGAGPALSKSQDDTLAALRRLLDHQTLERIHVESETSITARKFAERLHADIRGAFHARMMRLQKFIDEGDLTQAEQEIDALVEALRENHPSVNAPPTMSDLLDFLHHWDGIVSITHTLDRDDVPSELIEPVTTIVTNAVNDAVRHGGAEQIGVSCRREGDELVLRVTNDGSELSGSGSEGLGHATLERLAPGAWERSRGEGVTELAVRFAVAA